VDLDDFVKRDGVDELVGDINDIETVDANGDELVPRQPKKGRGKKGKGKKKAARDVREDEDSADLSAENSVTNDTFDELVARDPKKKGKKGKKGKGKKKAARDMQEDEDSVNLSAEDSTTEDPSDELVARDPKKKGKKGKGKGKDKKKVARHAE
jgi:hypothetical protein